ncbi:hypothetical protein RRG08_005829, partial [Elysia crispata]
SEEDEFVDASEHQLEERELTVSLPHTTTDMMHSYSPSPSTVSPPPPRLSRRTDGMD